MIMILFFVALVVILLYYYGTRNYNYWKVRGIKYDKPYPFVGNSWSQIIQKASFAMLATETYRRYPNEKIVGFYRGTQPELVIRDPEIIKRILVTDFHCFYARAIHPHKTFREPLLRNLFFADGDLWRLLRHRFTPAFSTAKLKGMFHMITDTAEKLQLVTEEVTKLDSYNARDLMGRYTTEFIGLCGFGLDMNSLGEENSQFRKLGNRIFQRNLRDVIVSAIITIFPESARTLNLLSPELETSMLHLVRTVMEQRNYKPSGRNDFIDLLLKIKESQGTLSGESIEYKNLDGSSKMVEIELDEMLMVAQIFVFFGAGFETSSGASSFTLHQLAFNPECQVKAQEEIDRVLAKYDNKITYEAVKEMNYLEMSFLEAMRMYPSVGFLMRGCTVPSYTIPEVNVTIDNNVRVMIPIQALHMDEKYFENPEKFDPSRFHPEKRSTINNFVYLPFGEGQRACVGARLGQMQSIAGLVAVLQKYSVEPATSSLKNPLPDPSGVVAESFIGGLPLKFKKRVK